MAEDSEHPPEPLVEGEDYVWESGNMVFTSEYHKKRGYCCESGCRNCPFGNAPTS